MPYIAALTMQSSNRKTGPMPVSMTSAKTCPNACPLSTANSGGCYAASGNTAIHWRNLDNGKRGKPWADFLYDVEGIRKGAIWRHNEAGDLPSTDNVHIDSESLAQLVRANKGRKGFTYTHYLPTIDSNAQAIKQANEQGFTINLSANNVTQAVEYMALNIAPVVTLLPIDAPNVQTIDGVKIVACPAEKSDKVTCLSCQLCQHSDRSFVIGFRAHGTSKKKANAIATNLINVVNI